MVLFVKLCPKNIEATVYAILLGSYNFSIALLAPLFGSLINDAFFHITNESLSEPGGEYSILEITILNMVLGVISILFIFLIPSNMDIEKRMKIHEGINN